MEKEILTHYEITVKTAALISVSQFDHCTVAIEAEKIYYISKPALQLLNEACLKGGASYEGRRAAVIFLTEAKNKVPIPVNPLEQIYAFPTHSPTQYNCSWIFFNHILSIAPSPHNLKQTMITFKNKQSISLPVSYYKIEKQFQRTASCILRFSHSTAFPKPNAELIIY